MVKSDNIRLDTIKRTNPFIVPEGYFDNFVTEVMSKLPDRYVEKPKVISLWEKVKPWVYIAAMFAGVALIINFIIRESDKRQDIVSVYASEGLKLNSSNDIDDYYHYYEDELTKIVYEDTIAGYEDDVATGDSDYLIEK